MIYNYHTHTPRCRHATGTPEEYIQKAIENGVKYMGFSDHAPCVFSDGHESGYRVPQAEVDDYVRELSELREKYKDKIDIKIGFEMEYYPSMFEKMLQNVKAAGAEYLILGQHFIFEEYPDGVLSNAETTCIDYLKRYVSEVVEAMSKGVYTYVAHPDVISFIGDREIYKKEMRKICVASREYNIPLEINFLGISENRRYPTDEFWEVAGEEKSPVTFGFDAHSTERAFDAKSLETAKKLVEKYNLNYIGMPKLKIM